MTSVNQVITDLKSEFQGGSSFSIDWYSILRRAADNVIDNINPETLKRRVPIYGGLTRHLQVYYCPTDVEVPTRIYSNDRSLFFDYVPPSYYWAHPWQRNKFTIEYVNGVRFIVIYHPLSTGSLTIDEMEDATQKSGTVTLSVDTFNTLPGATASMRGTFSDTSYQVTGTIIQPLDISNYLYGAVIVPAFFDSAENISAITLKLKTDTGDYYSFASSQDSVGNYLTDGQNMIRFWMQNASKTGTPDPKNIGTWELDIQMKSGTSQTVVLGKITIQASQLFTLEYQSNQLFIDGSTNAWKSTPVSGDSVNLNRDALGILHYEAAMLVVQAATTEQVNAAESQRIQAALARKYQQYWDSHPSAEEPLNYDISPEISLYPDPFFELGFYDLPERIGQSSDSVFGPTVVNFADAEVPAGAIDGANKTYTLLRAPDPAASLILIFNGQVLTAGVDFTLNANIITMTTAIPAIDANLAFTASYRYTSTL